jgi:predicted AAA+ superfamily ATPase
MGLYAENLVVRELITWPERIEVSYFREKNREVDFILTYGGNRYLPIEVKSRERKVQTASLDRFMSLYKLNFGVVITREKVPAFDKFLYLPLRYFLLTS